MLATLMTRMSWLKLKSFEQARLAETLEPVFRSLHRTITLDAIHDIPGQG